MFNFRRSNSVDNHSRIFCISMQRTGTTSVGRFFRDFGFTCVGWPEDKRNQWSESWYNGDFEKIFSSKDFRTADTFEDSPWFLPEFYKFLYHRFPGSRFVLFTRDPDHWFSSLLRHSNGHHVGNARRHCKVYRRELEFWDLVNKGIVDAKGNLIPSEADALAPASHAMHYKRIFELHNKEVMEFFRKHNPTRLFTTALEDKDKWLRLGDYLELDVPGDYEARENVSQK